jgi:type IV pilus assembly protein PilW
MSSDSRALGAKQQGLSLIELLVAMAIGLIVTLAASTVLLNFEGNKRTMTTVNDLNQAGAFASYTIERTVRNAGSGFAVRGDEGYGCIVNASLNNNAVLPAPSALPAPFAGISTTFRLAPAIIYAGESETGSDVLGVMAGNQGFSELPIRVIDGSMATDSLRLPNTLGWRAGDLALIMQSNRNCMVQQVGNSASTFVGTTDQTLPFYGSYYAANGTNVALSDYGSAGANVHVAALGNVGPSRPVFQLIGVGAGNVLRTHDLLRFNGLAEEPQPLLDGVTELRAVYGVDTDLDGDVDAWQDPSVAPWNAATLLNGTASSRTLLRQIGAVRIGLILRTSLAERTEQVSAPENLELFRSVGLSYTPTLTGDDRLFRYRAVEFTVPLRNVLFTNLN